MDFLLSCELHSSHKKNHSMMHPDIVVVAAAGDHNTAAHAASVVEHFLPPSFLPTNVEQFHEYTNLII
jgi:hypothetical protein